MQAPDVPFETHPLQRAMSKSWPADQWQDVTILVAVSGGPDSVALLRCLLEMVSPCGLGRICVGHFNHRQRGADSDDDERFVVELCQQTHLPCYTARGKPLSRDGRAASESSLRSARYRFLTSKALELGARFLVTGHTADDQVETILHRVIRGTGLSGLAGIPRVRQVTTGLTLIRPQLSVRRQQILDFLSDVGQPYRCDASNRELAFTRNRIRHELLPALRAKFNPAVDESVLRLGELARGASELLHEQVGRWLEAHAGLNPAAATVHIELQSFRNSSTFLCGQILRAVWQAMRWPLGSMTHEHWLSIVEIAHHSQSRLAVSLPDGVHAQRCETTLELSRSSALTSRAAGVHVD